MTRVMMTTGDRCALNTCEHDPKQKVLSLAHLSLRPLFKEIKMELISETAVDKPK